MMINVSMTTRGKGRGGGVGGCLFVFFTHLSWVSSSNI